MHAPPSKTRPNRAVGSPFHPGGGGKGLGDRGGIRNFRIGDFLDHPHSLPQPLSRPAGRKRGANSRIWPRVSRQEVHAHGCVGSDGELRGVARSRIGNSCTGNCRPTQRRKLQRSIPRRCTTHLQRRGHIGLLTPLSTPAGVERGWGIGGGIQNFRIGDFPTTTKLPNPSFALTAESSNHQPHLPAHLEEKTAPRPLPRGD